jgi:hypothetical protein
VADIRTESAEDQAQEGSEGAPLTEEDQDKKLLQEAKDFLKLAEEAEADIRREALDDILFSSGEQWDAQVRASREQKRRPCLTINRLPQFIRQVTNDQRQNRPSIKVHPVDDRADVETAKVIQGLIRHIEYNSSADSARDNAFDGAVRGGFGYYRVTTEYRDSDTFEQDILIKRIRNQFSVYADPYSQEPDGSDWKKASIVEDLSPEDFRAQFPNAKLSAAGAWESYGNTEPDWVKGDHARVAEYFYVKFDEKTLCLLDNGQTVLKDELPQYLASLPPVIATDGSPILPQVVRERPSQVRRVCWCKHNGVEILEKGEWAGKYIPIIPVYGEELYIDGKRTLKGIVRDAKDPQRMLNVWKSAETEAIGLAPKAPWVADAKTIEGYEDVWANANTENYSVLPFNARPDAPAPQRQSFEPAVQAITQAAMLAADDLKATTGIYDASLGARSNEQSGIAIQRRNVQAQTSNFHFTDNLSRSIRHEGRILIDLIPHIYDTERAARIIGEDGTEEIVKLNAPTDKMGPDGKPLIYDLKTGKYDAIVDVGPSYASKRQEAASAMQELSKSIPAIGQAAPDLVVKFMDVPGAQELADRLKKTLPPGFIDDPSQKQQPIPPQVQAQIQQMQMALEQADKDRADLLKERESKLIEIESRERIAMAELETKATIELAKLQSGEALKVLAHQIAELDARTQMLNMTQPFPDLGAQYAQPQLPDGSPDMRGRQPKELPPADGAYPGAEFGDGGLGPSGGEMSPEQPPMEGDYQ